MARLQAAGYVARSAYKLQEIQEKHKLIKPGSQVLDLGCHPGAWLQVQCAAKWQRAGGSQGRRGGTLSQEHSNGEGVLKGLSDRPTSQICPLQVACESLGPVKKGGRVIGVDLQVSD